MIDELMIVSDRYGDVSVDLVDDFVVIVMIYCLFDNYFD